MTESIKGYFSEEFIRDIDSTGLGRFCGVQMIDLMDPDIQRRTARQAVIRALRQKRCVEILRRYVPFSDGTFKEVSWTGNLALEVYAELAGEFYRKLVSFEGKPPTAEVIDIIDEFCRKELCSTNQ